MTAEEGLTKNPIRNRLAFDAHGLPPSDELTAIVASARDQFHSYVAKTIRSAYRRPAIYLVDDWVTHALGVFELTGRPVRDGRKIDTRTTVSHARSFEPGALAAFDRVHALFQPLLDLQRLAQGCRPLLLQPRLADVWAATFALIEPVSDLPLERRGALSARASQAHLATQHLGRMILRAGDVLRRDEELGQEVDDSFFAEVVRAERKLHDAIEGFEPIEGRALIRGFSTGRHSGVIFESLPALDIEAPAVLLSPNAIRVWSQAAPKVDVPPREQWLGVARPEHVGFALALGNVVQHELTHAMLSLSNDLPEGERTTIDSEQAQAQWRLYATHPELEEGMANFLALLVTLNTMQLCRLDVRHHQVADLRRRPPPRDDEAWADWSAHDYYGESTNFFRDAWRHNGHRLGDFAGVFHSYSTHVRDNDWEHFLHELRGHRIVLNPR